MATTLPGDDAPPLDDDGATPREVDAAALTLLLDGEHRALRERVRGVLVRPAFLRAPSPDRARYRKQVMRLLRDLADEGLGLVGSPEDVGGLNDPAGGVIVFETLGYGDLSLLVKFGVQFGLFGGAIHRL